MGSRPAMSTGRKGNVHLLAQTLFDLSDEMATRINIEFYANAADAFQKVILD